MGIRVSGGRACVKHTRSARSAVKAPIGSFSNLRRVPRVSAVSVAAAVAGILYMTASAAYAAEETPTEAAPTAGEGLQEVVVTANAAQGLRKLDASYNIVSVSLEDLRVANPQSTAEAFKLSPGVWPEASGGQTGANIDIAGFPNGGGDSPYFTTMIQGSPLYGSASLSFMDSSSLTRLDDTIERLEIVQGGTSSIFSSGQPGATANFILRTGSDKTTGSIGATYGFEGMERVDAFYGGKIADGWYASIGGFYRVSNGVRDPQYASDVGGQLTGTLKHTWDDGSLLFWYRTLNDKNQWYADFPYIVNGSSVSTYPGFNQLNSTYNSKQLQNLLIPNPGGGFRNDDISSGRGGQLNYGGADFTQKFDGGWSIINNFLVGGGYLDTHALVNNANPVTLGAYITGLTLPAGLSAAAVIPTFANGAPVSLAQSTVTQQVWYIEKKLFTITDEFRLAKDFGNGNVGTAGVYFAHYTDNDAWSLGSNVLITNQPNASPIILQGVAGGSIYNITSPQGVIANGGYNILESGRATNVAVYLSDSWKIDRLLLDASVRLEHIDLNQQTSNLANQQLGSVFNLWDNKVDLPNGTFTARGEHNTMPTFSVGANYEITDNMSAYVRVNNGVLFHNFDDVRCNVNNGSNGCPVVPTPLTTVRNYELGYKMQNEFAYIDASIYDKEFSGLQRVPVDINNVPIGPAVTYGTTAKGLRFIATLTPFAAFDNDLLKGAKLTVNGNYEDAKYKGYPGCFIYKDINGNTICGTTNGVQLARLPKFQVRVTPSDTQNFGWGTVTEYLTYEHIGQHYQDGTGLNPLGSYYDIGAGVVADIGENWEFRVAGTNLTNQLGLTEGNARVGGNAVQNGVGFGRSIEGREVNIQAKYKF